LLARRRRRLSAAGDKGAYRAETVSVVEGRKSDTSTYEFVPPDRRRVVFIDGLGRIWLEAIKIATQVWARHGQSGWCESPAGSTLAALFGCAPERVPVTCLGVVEFSGKTYIGYQARYNPKPRVAIAHVTLEPSKAEPSVLQLQELRMTILVERETALVEHEIVAAQDELAAPTSRTHYTFSQDIVIEAPVR
jgi:hypothetical protein